LNFSTEDLCISNEGLTGCPQEHFEPDIEYSPILPLHDFQGQYIFPHEPSKLIHSSLSIK